MTRVADRKMKRALILIAFAVWATLVLGSTAFAGIITYTYDKKAQLTRVDYGDGSVTDYTYDAAGNRMNAATCVGKSTNPQTVQNTVQAAVAAGGTVKIRDLTFVENVNIAGSVTLKGGYNCNFVLNAGYSFIQGLLSITGGPVVVENIVIK